MSNKCRSKNLWCCVAILVFVGASSRESISADTTRTNYWAPKEPPRAHYTINCSIDPSNGFLEGTEIIRFKNTTSQPMYRLAMKSCSQKNMEITVNGKPVSILAEQGSDDIILFELPEPIRPGDQVNLEIKFAGVKPIRKVGDNMGFIGWHPKLWWGFATHDDFNITVEAPKECRILTSGRFDQQTNSYHGEGIRLFALILIDKDFNVIEANAKDVLVRCVYTPEGEKCARLLVNTAVDVINFYRERLVFIPIPA